MCWNNSVDPIASLEKTQVGPRLNKLPIHVLQIWYMTLLQQLVFILFMLVAQLSFWSLVTPRILMANLAMVIPVNIKGRWIDSLLFEIVNAFFKH